MLQSFGLSFPFLLLRTLLVVAEGVTLYFGSVYIHSIFLKYISEYIDGLFLTIVSPMGFLFGIGISAVIVKYVFGFVQYYFKLAHIVYLTTLILEYKPFRGSRFVYSLKEATVNFGSLALNDFTTRGVVKALQALKDSILATDLMSKFKESNNSMVRFVKALCVTGLSNVINMTDEVIVSYTWFTNNLYLAHRTKQGKGPPNLKDKIKNQTSFMLEGMVFTVRVLPQLMINSLVFEVLFLILAHVIIISVLIAGVGYLGFNLYFIFFSLLLFRTFIKLFYYGIVESLRLNVYLYAFYREVEDLEPFNTTETLAALMGKVPLLSALVKKSGQKIEATGSEGSPILEGDFQEILRDNVSQVASAFNLNTNDIVDDTVEDLAAVSETTEVVEGESEDVDGDEVQEETGEQQTSTTEPEPEVHIELDSSDIEIEVNTEETNNPFNNAARAPSRRRK